MTDPGQPICANCGARLTGEYCAQCGQHSSDVRVSIRTLANDFLAEHVGLDKKVPTTIWRLIRHPGALTTDYLAGKRARYVLPLKLYLSASLVFFLVLAFRGPGSLSLGTAKFTASDSAAVDSARREFSAKNAADTGATPKRDSTVTKAPSSSLGARALSRAEQRIQGQSSEQITEFVLSGFRRYLPNMIFAMLPVFALILYLLYLRSGRFYAEHLIFALHFHAFVFVALTLAALMPGDLIGQVVPVVVFVYLFIAMRQVYGENRMRTSVKFAAATTTYLVSLLFASLVVMAGVFLAG